MKIVLDEKQCLKDKLTLQEALIATAVSMGDFKSTIDNMVNRRIITLNTSEVLSEWRDTIKKLTGCK